MRTIEQHRITENEGDDKYLYRPLSRSNGDQRQLQSNNIDREIAREMSETERLREIGINRCKLAYTKKQKQRDREIKSEMEQLRLKQSETVKTHGRLRGRESEMKTE